VRGRCQCLEFLALRIIFKMPLGTAATIGVAAGAGALSAWGQERANQKNLQIAREQMAFQERMSGSAYQRSMKDMKLAGLNPMLAYQQGGASSPGGASATMEDITAPALSSAMQARRMRADLKLIEKQVKNVEAQTIERLALGREAHSRAVKLKAENLMWGILGSTVKFGRDMDPGSFAFGAGPEGNINLNRFITAQIKDMESKARISQAGAQGAETYGRAPVPYERLTAPLLKRFQEFMQSQFGRFGG
jgi:hypothetical protein